MMMMMMMTVNENSLMIYLYWRNKIQ